MCSLQVKRHLNVRRFHEHRKLNNIKSKPHFSQKKERLEFQGAIVGIREHSRGIGLWTMPEDAKEPKENQVLIRESGLVGRGQGPVTTNK